MARLWDEAVAEAAAEKKVADELAVAEAVVEQRRHARPSDARSAHPSTSKSATVIAFPLPRRRRHSRPPLRRLRRRRPSRRRHL